MADNDVVRIIYGPPPPTADPADRFVSLDEALAGLPEAMEGAVLKALGAGGVMAEEWSKPVKDEDGDWRSETVGAPMGHYHDALLRDGYIGEGMDRTTAIPAHVALRLLAAEASDRLGWVWEVERDNAEHFVSRENHGPRFVATCPMMGIVWRMDDPGTFYMNLLYRANPLTVDNHLASLHGCFLAEDALREAGQ